MRLARNILAVLVAVLGIPLMIPLIILALPFFLICSMTQAMAYLGKQKHSPWNAIIQFQRDLGWEIRPNLNTHYLATGNDVCHVATDSHGWIGKSALSESDIVVFGDSFAFGYGVDLCDAYLSLNPRLKVKAISSPGYNMVQEVLLMRELSSKLAKKMVVWFICLENDLYDNLRPTSQHPQHVYPRPFVRRIDGQVGWEIVTSHVDSTKLSCPTLRTLYAETFAKLCAPGPLSSHVYSAANFLLKKGHDACAKAGAELVVLTIPNKLQMSEQGIERILSKLPNKKGFDPDYPDCQFDEMCQKLAVPFLPAKKHLNLHDYKEYDWHWTKKGHKRISQLLREFYGDFRAGSLQLAPRHRHDRTRFLLLARSQ